MKQIVYIQGSSLSLTRAHWIQILHTANALAEQGVARLILIPRTVEPGTIETLADQIGYKLSSNITIRPLVEFDDYKRKRITGNLLTKKQKFTFRRYGRQRLQKILEDELDPNVETIVYTRDQEIPIVCEKVLSKWNPVFLNEIHKFEYVNRLDAKIKKYKEKPKPLKWYRNFARKEKEEEFHFLNQFHGIVCTTENIAMILKRSNIQAETLVIPNGTLLPDDVDIDEANKRARDIDLLYVGQLIRWKNVDLVIKTLPLLPDIKFHIVGGEPNTSDWNRIQDLTTKFKVQDRVVFHGQKPHHEVASFMRRAKAGVVPLPLSGFPEARMFCCPLKAIELMANGTPIVASNLKSLSGFLTEDHNACLVKPDDSQSLADGIMKVLNDNKYQANLIKGGLETATNLSYTKRAQRILQFAEKLNPVAL